MADAPSTWVVVCGGLHRRGGMDRANAALVDYLLARGDSVHAVVHHVDESYVGVPRLSIHQVHPALGSLLIGEFQLEARARAVHRSLPGATLVANGGNCPTPDVNWVHSVHTAWPAFDRGAPLWFRAKNRVMKGIVRARERRAIRRAALVVANSQRTAREVRTLLGVPPERIVVVPLGADEDAAPVTPEARAAARVTLGISDEVPVVAFVGALSHDNNKGFDVLLDAWTVLAARGVTSPVLVAAGGGSGVDRWRAEATRRGLADRVRLLGFTSRLPALLAGCDLLASPARYEAFGLNVHEAITRDIPVLVSASAGVVERMPPYTRLMVLEHPTDAAAVAARVEEWLGARALWSAAARDAGAQMRQWRWHHMAGAIVDEVERRIAAPGTTAGRVSPPPGLPRAGAR